MSNSEPSKKMDPTITAAIIGVVGTILVTVITVFGSRFFNPQPTTVPPTAVVNTEIVASPVVPTNTIAPNEPTSTPEPPTDTPTATLAPVTPVALGEDWPQDCISTLWRPEPFFEPAPLGNGCLEQPIHFFVTENGNLNFQDDGRNSSSSVYGLFAPLPGTEGSVTIKVSLQELSKADLLLGVYGDMDLGSEGVLMAIPAGDVKKQKILRMLSFDNYKTEESTAPIDQLNGYSITFNYSPTSVTASVPGVLTFRKVTVPGAQKYIFLGYRNRGPSYNADGTFLSLELK